MRIGDGFRGWFVAVIVVSGVSGAAGAGQRGAAGTAGPRPPTPSTTTPPVRTLPSKPVTTPFSTALIFRPAGHGRRTAPPGRVIGPLAASPVWWWGGPEPAEGLNLPEASDEERRIVVPLSPEPSSIQPAETSTRPPVAASEAGAVRLDVTPSTAVVYVDGFYAGPVEAATESGGLSLGAGWHRLVFRAPGHETAGVNVTVTPHALITVRLALLSR